MPAKCARICSIAPVAERLEDAQQVRDARSHRSKSTAGFESVVARMIVFCDAIRRIEQRHRMPRARRRLAHLRRRIVQPHDARAHRGQLVAGITNVSP